MNYLTNDTELTAVANAIREKCDISNSLEWPNGFIQAIEDCETGGPELKWLWGNQITNTLSGTIDSTDDAYAGPILSLDVDGVSTQVTTTGKNLFDKTAVTFGVYLKSDGTTASYGPCATSTFIPIVGGETYAISFGKNRYNLGTNYIAWYTDADESSKIGDTVSISNINTTSPKVAPSGASFVRFSCNRYIIDSVQFELGSNTTTYEPYSGTRPSPSPDYPQTIVSTDSPSIHMSSKQRMLMNQLVYDGNMTDANNWAKTNARMYVSIADGEATVTARTSGEWITFGQLLTASVNQYYVTNYTTLGHKFYGSFEVKGTIANVRMGLNSGNSGDRVLCATTSANTNTFKRVSGIYTLSTLTTGNSLIISNTPAIENTNVDDYFTVRNIMVVDLTKMFGDGNEPSTAAEFEALYPNTYYDFDPDGTWNDVPNWPVSLYDGTLRSLPNGTKDKLHLTYFKPSKRKGWAWYSKELVQRTHLVTFDGSENWVRLSKQNDSGYYFAISTDRTNPLIVGTLSPGAGNQKWSHYMPGNAYDSSAASNTAWFFSNTDWNYNTIRTSRPDNIETAEEYKAWLAENPITVVYELRDSTTTTLDPIELPIMPSENVTVWCDGGSAQPTFMLEYIQDANIVISRLEDSIADLATS